MSEADDSKRFLSEIDKIYQAMCSEGAAVPPFVFVFFPVLGKSEYTVTGNVALPRDVTRGLHDAVNCVLAGKYNENLR